MSSFHLPSSQIVVMAENAAAQGVTLTVEQEANVLGVSAKRLATRVKAAITYYRNRGADTRAVLIEETFTDLAKYPEDADEEEPSGNTTTREPVRIRGWVLPVADMPSTVGGLMNLKSAVGFRKSPFDAIIPGLSPFFPFSPDG